jgi:hypothetical protein
VDSLSISAPSDQELDQAHSALARAALDHANLRIRSMLAADESLVTPDLRQAMALAAESPRSYPVAINIKAALYVMLKIEFYDDNRNNVLATFEAEGGGLAVGQALSVGTAWLNYDLDVILNQMKTARFEANFAMLATNVNLWDMSGTNIGNTASGGVGLGVGITGGQGTFIRGYVRH